MRRLRNLIALPVLVGSLVTVSATPSEAAVVDYFKNHALSRYCTAGTGCAANLSMSTTNPPSSGHIYSLKPGQAGTGACIYASASRLTMFWWAGKQPFALPAGKWFCPGQTSLQGTARIYP